MLNKKYEQHLQVVTSLINQREEYFKKIKTEEEKIFEIQKVLKKFDMAIKSRCDINELMSIDVKVPSQHLGGIIGKKGSNLQRLENECFVTIQVHLFYFF